MQIKTCHRLSRFRRSRTSFLPPKSNISRKAFPNFNNLQLRVSTHTHSKKKLTTVLIPFRINNPSVINKFNNNISPKTIINNSLINTLFTTTKCSNYNRCIKTNRCIKINRCINNQHNTKLIIMTSRTSNNSMTYRMTTKKVSTKTSSSNA